MSNTATTFIAIKPDGVQKQIIGEVISRFERLGYTLKAIKSMRVTPELAKEHYKEHVDKPFFGELVEYITSDTIIAMAWEGENIVEIVRKVVGATNPVQASPGTIRGDFATSLAANIIHASDSLESAARELGLFFPEMN